MDSNISTKGQVTVPIAVRRRLGLRAGDRVEFVISNGEVILRPAIKGNPFEQDLGILPAFQNTQQVKDWVSEMRDED